MSVANESIIRKRYSFTFIYYSPKNKVNIICQKIFMVVKLFLFNKNETDDANAVSEVVSLRGA
nr:MAG TPA: hypothetical protein [Caudoviricetes sp.]